MLVGNKTVFKSFMGGHSKTNNIGLIMITGPANWNWPILLTKTSTKRHRGHQGCNLKFRKGIVNN